MSDFLDTAYLDPQKISRNKIVEGTVISITKDEVVVDLGAKAEGIILSKELRSEKDFIDELKVGDVILASVNQVENDHGQIVLSLKRAGMERRWRILEEAYKNKKTVKVKVIDHNRGGLLVDCGIRGFIPVSQLSQDLLSDSASQEVVQKNLRDLKGKDIDVFVLEANRVTNKLILSARPLDQIKFSSAKREETLTNVKVDDVIEGIVSRIVPFGILVDIGGFEGLAHISEVSWDRLKKPEDLYNVGDKVKVIVIEKNERDSKVLLSIKRLQKDPWEEIGDKYKENQEVEGEVTKITPFGAFVRVEKGIDGLVHSSKLLDLNLELTSGDKGLFKIASLDVSQKRMSLEPIIAAE